MATSKQGGLGFNYRGSVNGRYLSESQAQRKDPDIWEREPYQPQSPSTPSKKQ